MQKHLFGIVLVAWSMLCCCVDDIVLFEKNNGDHQVVEQGGLLYFKNNVDHEFIFLQATKDNYVKFNSAGTFILVI